MAKHEYDVCGVLKVSETSQGAKDKTSDYILEMDLRVVLLGTKRDSEFSESSHALMMAKCGTLGEKKVEQNEEQRWIRVLTLILERHKS